MSNDQFIGRGEREVEQVLRQLFPTARIVPQFSIAYVIKREEYDLLDEEFQKHNCDFFMSLNGIEFVIEVNYKHKEKAAQKWSNVFSKLIKESGRIPLTIEDYNCEYLFSDSKTLKKKHPWGALFDIVRELERQGVGPDGTLFKTT